MFFPVCVFQILCITDSFFFFFSDRISARVTLEHSRYLFQMKVVASLEKSAPKGLSLCMKEGK